MIGNSKENFGSFYFVIKINEIGCWFNCKYWIYPKRLNNLHQLIFWFCFCQLFSNGFLLFWLLLRMLKKICKINMIPLSYWFQLLLFQTGFVLLFILNPLTVCMQGWRGLETLLILLICYQQSSFSFIRIFIAFAYIRLTDERILLRNMFYFSPIKNDFFWRIQSRKKNQVKYSAFIVLTQSQDLNNKMISSMNLFFNVSLFIIVLKGRKSMPN